MLCKLGKSMLFGMIIAHIGDKTNNLLGDRHIMLVHHQLVMMIPIILVTTENIQIWVKAKFPGASQ